MMTLPNPASDETDGPPPRLLRADARRNRARILEAAEVVFASAGAAATTDEIAQRAGVGIGTLFRHFPTKESLLEAIILARVWRLIEEIDALIAEGNPESAFFAFFTYAAEQATEKKTFTDLLIGSSMNSTVVSPELRQQLRGGIEMLLTRAQEVGAVRPDVRYPEVLALLVGTGRAVEFAGDDYRLRDRVLRIILDGFRPPEMFA